MNKGEERSDYNKGKVYLSGNTLLQLQGRKLKINWGETKRGEPYGACHPYKDLRKKKKKRRSEQEA